MEQYKFTFQNDTQEQISFKEQLSPNSWGTTIRIPRGESRYVTEDRISRTQKKYWLQDSNDTLTEEHVSPDEFRDWKQANVTCQETKFKLTLVRRTKEVKAGFTTTLKNLFKRNNSESTSLPTTSEGRSPV